MTVVAVVQESPPPSIAAKLARWVPDPVRREIARLEEGGELTRQALRARPGGRYLERFVGGPRDVVVAWIGLGPHNVEAQLYREFPVDLDFYVDYAGADTAIARLLHTTYTNFNRDLWHLVSERELSPEQAKQELRRLDAELTKLIVEALLVLSLSFGFGAAALRSYRNRTVKAIQESQRASRRIGSLALRRQARAIILYRGTTLRRTPGEHRWGVDDLGPGTYFSDSEEVARLFAQQRGTRLGEPQVVLRAEVTTDMLGRILDLTRPPYKAEWDSLVAMMPRGQVRNEQYLRLLEAFLGELGKRLEDFDTIIGPNYLQGGTQINIRTGAVLDRVLETATEVLGG